jgi:hypothetical protein
MPAFHKNAPGRRRKSVVQLGGRGRLRFKKYPYSHIIGAAQGPDVDGKIKKNAPEPEKSPRANPVFDRFHR